MESLFESTVMWHNYFIESLGTDNSDTRDELGNEIAGNWLSDNLYFASIQF